MEENNLKMDYQALRQRQQKQQTGVEHLLLNPFCMHLIQLKVTETFKMLD